MGYRSSDRASQAFETQEVDLSGGCRGLLILIGLAAMLLSFFLGFGILVMLGGGHGSPFGAKSLIEWLITITFLAVPVIVFAFGAACVRTTARRQLGTIAALMAAVPGLLVLAYVFQIIAARNSGFPGM